jgi:LEA14-like dessication related protein
MRYIVVLLLALLAGCAGIAGLSQKPELSLVGIDLLEFAMQQQRFEIRLTVLNPNDIALPISALDFSIELGGAPFASGASEQAVTVPPRGEALLQVKANSDLGRVLKQWREMKRSTRGRIDYTIRGTVAVRGVGEFPFERQGDVQLPQFNAAPRQTMPGT